MLGEVSARPVRLPADDEFLLAVYAAARAPELSMLGWPGAQVDAFIRMQFDAQTRHYRWAYPQARDALVTVDGEPAGRLIVERTDGEIRIVDLALLPRFRRAGLGSELIRRVFAEADGAGLPVRCHVEHSNDASRRFLEQLGLVACGVDGAHIAMERACATSPR